MCSCSELEVWKTIPNYERYEVSSHGRVKSHVRASPIVLKPFVPARVYGRTAPYPSVSLCNSDGTRRIRIHRLVLKVFHGTPRPGLESDHLDGDIQHNCVDNLKWSTHVENSQRRTEHGTQAIGERNVLAKLTDKEVVSIRKESAAGACQPTLVRKFGVSRQTIHRVINRITWKHVE